MKLRSRPLKQQARKAIKTICWMLVLLLLSIQFSSSKAVSTRIYVDQDATGANDGTSWLNAYEYLQDALDETNANGSTDYEIWVAEGVYYPDEDKNGGHTDNNQSDSFSILYDNVRLYGGFSGGETNLNERDWVTNVTILSGDIDGNDTNTDGNYIAEDWNDISGNNAYHVLYFDGVSYEGITANVMVDGFIVTAGFAEGGLPYGGAIYCYGASSGATCSPTFRNMKLVGNKATVGGAVMVRADGGGESNPTFTNVSFTNNLATADGGGMYGFATGSASSESSPLFVNCSFKGNVAQSEGGGYYIYLSNGGTSENYFNNVEFIDNETTTYGGAIGNTVTDGGNMFFDIRNSSFYGNQANIGGGMFNYKDATSSHSAHIYNSILWGNTAATTGDQIHNDNLDTLPMISYSDVQDSNGSGASWDTGIGQDGGNNIDQDPLFTNAAGGDLTLQASSPVIDAGNQANLFADYTDLDEDGNTAELTPYDLAMNSRVENSDVDMGAYEHGPLIKDNVGFYVPSKYRWYLKTTRDDGWSGVTSFGWGGVSELVPVVGDWDGDGVQTAAFYKPSQWKWFIKNDFNDGWAGVTNFNWGGNTEMIPIAGDWDGDGDDTVGFFKPAASEWYLKDDNTAGWTGFTTVTFGGASGNIPIVGDWDGDGDDTIGFFVPSTNRWWLKNDLTDGWGGVTGFNFGTADPMDPVTGDWDGDGIDTVGGYTAAKWRWFLKDDQVDGWSSVSNFKFGVTVDYEALAGDWE